MEWASLGDRTGKPRQLKKFEAKTLTKHYMVGTRILHIVAPATSLVIASV